MLDEISLKDLAATQSSGPILSVYLNVDPTQRTAEEYKLHLREMLKQVNDLADAKDIEAVKRYVELEFDWSGRGLAIFSKRTDDLWAAYPLAVPVDSSVTVAHRPRLSPLVQLFRRYGRYGVALVDRQGSRFFAFLMGQLLAQDGVLGEDVRHTRKGRGSSMVGMRGGAPHSGRREAELVQRNLRESITSLGAFVQAHHLHQLLLAGAEATVSQFRELLPAPLEGLVVGTFAADMAANEIEIRDLSFAILEKLAHQHQQQLTNTVVTATAKGQNGVIGLDATLSVIHEGRVQALIVEAGFHQPGYRCAGCGYLTAQPMERCVFCGGKFEQTPDAVEDVVCQAVANGIDVDIVPSDTIAKAKIGALLRY